ncbi:putative phage tail assembly chaperone [Pseudoalteromonas luteoviolacea]|uniref:Phage protein n=1 Tax=Pseudoalteromonas luteoviolacea S4060-1 TaxID=1365257 RepID=A0A167JRG7_9GAMM|nr:putative phage tail assembly chaperone [Pseudoalteromonas luteoviolacea]KZN61556.1 hypothetical protein N478_05670 [Pseudoalteromonas luteoviolacea S4060-1]
MLNQKIVIDTGETDFTFNVTSQAYNKYLNSATPTNKVQPATNFLLSTVEDSQTKELKELVKQPGAAFHLVGLVVDEYQPEFNFTVKKSKSEPSE